MKNSFREEEHLSLSSKKDNEINIKENTNITMNTKKSVEELNELEKNLLEIKQKRLLNYYNNYNEKKSLLNYYQDEKISTILCIRKNFSYNLSLKFYFNTNTIKFFIILKNKILLKKKLYNNILIYNKKKLLYYFNKLKNILLKKKFYYNFNTFKLPLLTTSTSITSSSPSSSLIISTSPIKSSLKNHPSSTTSSSSSIFTTSFINHIKKLKQKIISNTRLPYPIPSTSSLSSIALSNSLLETFNQEHYQSMINSLASIYFKRRKQHEVLLRFEEYLQESKRITDSYFILEIYYVKKLAKKFFIQIKKYIKWSFLDNNKNFFLETIYYKKMKQEFFNKLKKKINKKIMYLNYFYEKTSYNIPTIPTPPLNSLHIETIENEERQDYNDEYYREDEDNREDEMSQSKQNEEYNLPVYSYGLPTSLIPSYILFSSFNSSSISNSTHPTSSSFHLYYYYYFYYIHKNMRNFLNILKKKILYKKRIQMIIKNTSFCKDEEEEKNEDEEENEEFMTYPTSSSLHLLIDDEEGKLIRKQNKKFYFIRNNDQFSFTKEQIHHLNSFYISNILYFNFNFNLNSLTSVKKYQLGKTYQERQAEFHLDLFKNYYKNLRNKVKEFSPDGIVGQEDIKKKSIKLINSNILLFSYSLLKSLLYFFSSLKNKLFLKKKLDYINQYVRKKKMKKFMIILINNMRNKQKFLKIFLLKYHKNKDILFYFDSSSFPSSSISPHPSSNILSPSSILPIQEKKLKNFSFLLRYYKKFYLLVEKKKFTLNILKEDLLRRRIVNYFQTTFLEDFLKVKNFFISFISSLRKQKTKSHHDLFYNQFLVLIKEEKKLKHNLIYDFKKKNKKYLEDLEDSIKNFYFKLDKLKKILQDKEEKIIKNSVSSSITSSLSSSTTSPSSSSPSSLPVTTSKSSFTEELENISKKKKSFNHLLEVENIDTEQIGNGIINEYIGMEEEQDFKNKIKFFKDNEVMIKNKIKKISLPFSFFSLKNEEELENYLQIAEGKRKSRTSPYTSLDISTTSPRSLFATPFTPSSTTSTSSIFTFTSSSNEYESLLYENKKLLKEDEINKSLYDEIHNFSLISHLSYFEDDSTIFNQLFIKYYLSYFYFLLFHINQFYNQFENKVSYFENKLQELLAKKSSSTLELSISTSSLKESRRYFSSLTSFYYFMIYSHNILLRSFSTKFNNKMILNKIKIHFYNLIKKKRLFINILKEKILQKRFRKLKLKYFLTFRKLYSSYYLFKKILLQRRKKRQQLSLLLRNYFSCLIPSPTSTSSPYINKNYKSRAKRRFFSNLRELLDQKKRIQEKLLQRNLDFLSFKKQEEEEEDSKIEIDGEIDEEKMKRRLEKKKIEDLFQKNRYYYNRYKLIKYYYNHFKQFVSNRKKYKIRYEEIVSLQRVKHKEILLNSFISFVTTIKKKMKDLESKKRKYLSLDIRYKKKIFSFFFSNIRNSIKKKKFFSLIILNLKRFSYFNSIRSYIESNTSTLSSFFSSIPLITSENLEVNSLGIEIDQINKKSTSKTLPSNIINDSRILINYFSLTRYQTEENKFDLKEKNYMKNFFYLIKFKICFFAYLRYLKRWYFFIKSSQKNAKMYQILEKMTMKKKMKIFFKIMRKKTNKKKYSLRKSSLEINKIILSNNYLLSSYFLLHNIGERSRYNNEIIENEDLFINSNQELHLKAKKISLRNYISYYLILKENRQLRNNFYILINYLRDKHERKRKVEEFLDSSINKIISIKFFQKILNQRNKKLVENEKVMDFYIKKVVKAFLKEKIIDLKKKKELQNKLDSVFSLGIKKVEPVLYIPLESTSSSITSIPSQYDKFSINSLKESLKRESEASKYTETVDIAIDNEKKEIDVEDINEIEEVSIEIPIDFSKFTYDDIQLKRKNLIKLKNNLLKDFFSILLKRINLKNNFLLLKKSNELKIIKNNFIKLKNYFNFFYSLSQNFYLNKQKKIFLQKFFKILILKKKNQNIIRKSENFYQISLKKKFFKKYIFKQIKRNDLKLCYSLYQAKIMRKFINKLNYKKTLFNLKFLKKISERHQENSNSKVSKKNSAGILSSPSTVSLLYKKLTFLNSSLSSLTTFNASKDLTDLSFFQYMKNFSIDSSSINSSSNYVPTLLNFIYSSSLQDIFYFISPNSSSIYSSSLFFIENLSKNFSLYFFIILFYITKELLESHIISGEFVNSDKKIKKIIQIESSKEETLDVDAKAREEKEKELDDAIINANTFKEDDVKRIFIRLSTCKDKHEFSQFFSKIEKNEILFNRIKQKFILQFNENMNNIVEKNNQELLLKKDPSTSSLTLFHSIEIFIKDFLSSNFLSSSLLFKTINHLMKVVKIHFDIRNEGDLLKKIIRNYQEMNKYLEFKYYFSIKKKYVKKKINLKQEETIKKVKNYLKKKFFTNYASYFTTVLYDKKLMIKSSTFDKEKKLRFFFNQFKKTKNLKKISLRDDYYYNKNLLKYALVSFITKILFRFFSCSYIDSFSVSTSVSTSALLSPRSTLQSPKSLISPRASSTISSTTPKSFSSNYQTPLHIVQFLRKIRDIVIETIDFNKREGITSFIIMFEKLLKDINLKLEMVPKKSKSFSFKMMTSNYPYQDYLIKSSRSIYSSSLLSKFFKKLQEKILRKEEIKNLILKYKLKFVNKKIYNDFLLKLKNQVQLKKKFVMKNNKYGVLERFYASSAAPYPSLSLSKEVLIENFINKKLFSVFVKNMLRRINLTKNFFIIKQHHEIKKLKNYFSLIKKNSLVKKNFIHFFIILKKYQEKYLVSYAFSTLKSITKKCKKQEDDVDLILIRKERKMMMKFFNSIYYKKNNQEIFFNFFLKHYFSTCFLFNPTSFMVSPKSSNSSTKKLKSLMISFIKKMRTNSIKNNENIYKFFLIFIERNQEKANEIFKRDSKKNFSNQLSLFDHEISELTNKSISSKNNTIIFPKLPSLPSYKLQEISFHYYFLLHKSFLKFSSKLKEKKSIKFYLNSLKRRLLSKFLQNKNRKSSLLFLTKKIDEGKNILLSKKKQIFFFNEDDQEFDQTKEQKNTEIKTIIKKKEEKILNLQQYLTTKKISNAFSNLLLNKKKKILNEFYQNKNIFSYLLNVSKFQDKSFNSFNTKEFFNFFYNKDYQSQYLLSSDLSNQLTKFYTLFSIPLPFSLSTLASTKLLSPSLLFDKIQVQELQQEINEKINLEINFINKNYHNNNFQNLISTFISSFNSLSSLSVSSFISSLLSSSPSSLTSPSTSSLFHFFSSSTNASSLILFLSLISKLSNSLFFLFDIIKIKRLKRKFLYKLIRKRSERIRKLKEEEKLVKYEEILKKKNVLMALYYNLFRNYRESYNYQTIDEQQHDMIHKENYLISFSISFHEKNLKKLFFKRLRDIIKMKKYKKLIENSTFQFENVEKHSDHFLL